MKKNNQIKTHPFTDEQLNHFKNEIDQAGSVDELMLQKKALIQNGESTTIAVYENIEEYKEKFLNGVYEPLQKNYSTTVPYAFWSRLYEALVREGIIK